MVVTIAPGEMVRIELEGTDGAFEISFDSKESPNAVVVRETESSSDDSERSGELYRESFG